MELQSVHVDRPDEDDSVPLESQDSAKAQAPARRPPLLLLPVDDRPFIQRVLNKGTISNCATLLILVAGAVWKHFDPQSWLAPYVLAFGLFGFAGGVTNSLAVKMLFDRIPGLYGSGVIPNHFREIRASVKDMIMRMFFDAEYLGDYLQQRAGELLTSMQLGDKLAAALSRPEVDDMIVHALTDVSQRQDQAGMMIKMVSDMMGGVPAMLPFIKPMLASFSGDVARVLVTSLDINEVMPVDRVREEVDRLLTHKLDLLTPQLVKRFIEDVIREHLGWLVIWGNVFGGVIGVVSLAVGYG